MQLKRRMAAFLWVSFFIGGMAFIGGPDDVPLSVYANEASLETIVDELFPYITQEQPDDPLLEVEPEIWVKTSNVKGIAVGGTTYYYSLLPHMSYDPIARGEISPNDVTVIYEENNSDFPITIYRLNSTWD